MTTAQQPTPSSAARRARQALLFAALMGAALLLLPRLEADAPQREALAARVVTRAQLAELTAALTPLRDAPKTPLTLTFSYDGPEASRAIVREQLSALPALTLHDAPHSASQGELRATLRPDDAQLGLTLQATRGERRSAEVRAAQRIGRWQAALVPLVAVLMALCFKRLLLALGSAIWLGAALQVGFWPHVAAWEAARRYVVDTTFNSFNAYVLGFTISLVGMVHLMLKMGGLGGLLERASAFAKGARGARVTTVAMGCLIFFDDYANTIVVGSTMRPLTDAMRISREKLAYLVDTTSAPIAGLAIISTWIGYEVGLFQELSAQLGLGLSGYDIFFAILPLRFYCILSLVFAGANAWSGRDYGPMRQAEARASAGQLWRPSARRLTRVSLDALKPDEGTPKRWYNAVIPIGAVLASTLLGMFWSGWRGPQGAQLPNLGQALWGDASLGALTRAWGLAAPELLSFGAWRDAFSLADNAFVLCASAIIGTLVALALALTQRLLTWRQASIAWLRAIPGMSLAIAILVLAWGIRAVCDDLGTSLFLVGALGELIAPQWLPLITFAMAAVVAFATGTSWGTMGILLPAVIPMAAQLGHGHPEAALWLMLCFGAVLDGAIFGDHCSPISDTTVMSSIATACDHLDHVRTQAPYALTVMSAAALFGYVGVAQGLPAWAALMLGAGALLLVLRVAGRHAPAAPG